MNLHRTALCLLLLAAPALCDEDKPPQRVQAPEHGVSFELPGNWREASSENSWFPFPTPAILACLTVEAEALPEGTTTPLERLADAKQPHTKPPGFETFTVLLDEVRTRKDGLSYAIHESQGKMTIDRDLRFRHVCLVHKGKLITVTAQIESNLWTELLPALDGALATLTLGKLDPAAARRVDVPDARLSVHLPDGWSKSPALGAGVVAVLVGDGGLLRVTVRVEEGAGLKTRDLLARLTRDSDASRKLRVSRKGKRKRDDGAPSYALDYRVKLTGYPDTTPTLYRGRRLALVHADKLIVVEAEAPADRWESLSAGVDAVAAALELHPK